MNKKQQEMSCKLVKELVDSYDSLREFARYTNQDVADIYRWKLGRTKIRAQAVVEFCRLFDCDPNLLRPDIFPAGIKLIFKK
jgi:hypothetical protein